MDEQRHPAGEQGPLDGLAIGRSTAEDPEPPTGHCRRLTADARELGVAFE